MAVCLHIIPINDNKQPSWEPSRLGASLQVTGYAGARFCVAANATILSPCTYSLFLVQWIQLCAVCIVVSVLLRTLLGMSHGPGWIPTWCGVTSKGDRGGLPAWFHASRIGVLNPVVMLGLSRMIHGDV